jgi:hypothetical protein
MISGEGERIVRVGPTRLLVVIVALLLNLGLVILARSAALTAEVLGSVAIPTSCEGSS